MTMQDTPAILSVPAFSEHMGWKRTYGYQLKKEGRLVMAPDGKNVLVAESIALHAATRDLPRQGVADRHAAARSQSAKAEPPPAVEDDGEDGDPLRRYDYHGSKAKREHWAAEREHANFRKDAGELMERSAVVAAFADAGATLRGKLEAWQAMLPPQLVGRDESAIRTTLADQTERLLLDLVEKFGRMAAQEGGEQ